MLFLESDSQLPTGAGLGPVALLQGLTSCRFLQGKVMVTYSNKLSPNMLSFLSIYFFMVTLCARSSPDLIFTPKTQYSGWQTFPSKYLGFSGPKGRIKAAMYILIE